MLHRPEVSDTARMMSRKFSGSWNGSDADDLAELVREVAQLPRVDLLQLGEPHAAEAGEERGHRALELAWCRRTGSSTPMSRCARRAPPVARGDRDEELAQAARGGVGDLAHHPEVDERERQSRRDPRPPGQRRDEDVAGVRVGVEEAVDEELVEHHRRELGGDLGRVDPRGAERVEVVDLDRGDVLRA